MFDPDVIFHLAAYGNKYDQKNVTAIYTANIMRLLSLIKETDKIDYKAFIVIGTSSEYGTKDKPMKETDLLEPETFYAASKVGATHLARVWAIQRNKPIVIIRPFSLYGPGEGEHKFIPILTKSLFTDQRIKLAPGVHDWIHIDDFIDALLLVTKHANELKGQVVNIGTGIQHTNEEVAQMASEVSGIKLDIEKVGKLRDYDTSKSWVADITKIKKLGWTPKISLREGIKKYIEWYTPPGV